MESKPILQEAHDICTRAIDGRPDDASRYHLRGRIRDELYREDSIDDLETAANLDPTNASVLIDLAICTGMPIDRTLFDLGKAVTYAERAIEIDPDSCKALYLAGTLYAYRGDHERALESYANALRIEPDHALSYCGMAYVYSSKLRDHDRAIDLATRAIAIDPNDAWPLYERGIIYMRAGEFELALADYKEAERLSPNWSAPILARGTALLRRGDHQPAIAAFTTVVEKTNGKSENAWYGRAEAYEAIGDQHAAEQDLTKATEIFCNLKSYVNRAAFYQRINDRDAELADLTKTTELAHTTTELAHDIRSHLSRSTKRLVELGEFDLAKSIYKGALDRDPHRDVFIGRGDYYRDTSQLELAIADYTSAIAVDPTHARLIPGGHPSMRELPVFKRRSRITRKHLS